MRGKQLCEGTVVLTQLHCQIYKYLNYMFRPLWPSSGWIRNQMKIYIYVCVYNMVHDIHKCGVSGGRDLVYRDMEGL